MKILEITGKLLYDIKDNSAGVGMVRFLCRPVLKLKYTQEVIYETFNESNGFVCRRAGKGS